MQRFILKFSCEDTIGIVAAVAGFIASNGGSIIEASQHTDPEVNVFFLRQEIAFNRDDFYLDDFKSAFTPIAEKFKMDWQVSDAKIKKRVALLVSKQGHCLYDLLYRYAAAEMNIEIPCVISNHEEFRGLVEWHKIPFFYVPVNKDNKEQAYGEVARIFEETKSDLMVLARYMQVLSPEVCRKYHGKIINIHHSFLPSFVGAKPYTQAHNKGVKLIGATCHYVTEELDQGPIIEQDVIRVDHADTAEDLALYGKDVEKAVLARGLRYHIEDRVLINNKKTVVFR